MSVETEDTSSVFVVAVEALKRKKHYEKERDLTDRTLQVIESKRKSLEASHSNAIFKYADDAIAASQKWVSIFLKN